MTPTVTMRPMTEQEYDAYRQRSVPAYAADLERARGISPEATMLAAEELAREAGLRHIALNVFGWNSRAERLYHSLGYVTGWTQMSKPLVEQP
jgi:hypothetical protein